MDPTTAPILKHVNKNLDHADTEYARKVCPQCVENENAAAEGRVAVIVWDDPSNLKGHPRFYEALDEMARTHDKKNSDYANPSDPFANFRACEKAGISMTDGIYTRMSDKWERITNLLAKRRKGETPAVTGESLADTLIDLANYAIILRIALDESTPEVKRKFDPANVWFLKEARRAQVGSEPPEPADLCERMSQTWELSDAAH